MNASIIKTSNERKFADAQEAAYKQYQQQVMKLRTQFNIDPATGRERPSTTL